MKTNRWEQFRDACKEHFLEVFLTLIVLACCSLITALPTAKVAVLNLFFLPIVLAGFFLGRYRAGALALLSAITVGILVSGDYAGFASSGSPLIVSLTMTIWAAVLGLTAIVVGTLKDDLVHKAAEAREAQVGVIDILARYLQSVNPQLEHRAQRVARLPCRSTRGADRSSTTAALSLAGRAASWRAVRRATLRARHVAGFRGSVVKSAGSR